MKNKVSLLDRFLFRCPWAVVRVLDRVYIATNDFLDRFALPVAMVSVAVIIAMSFILGQLITTPIHLNTSSFHTAYAEWFNAGGCR